MSMAGPDRHDSDERETAFDNRWVLDVGGRVYGPYTGHALKEYKNQGRLAPHSIVARTGRPAGEEEWVRAADDPVLGSLFEDLDSVPVPTAPAHGGGEDSSDSRANTAPESFNLVVVTDSGSRRGWGALESAILSLGPTYKLAANIWIVRARVGAAEANARLAPHVGASTRLFVVDATTDRAAWSNMDPKSEDKIARVWKHPD